MKTTFTFIILLLTSPLLFAQCPDMVSVDGTRLIFFFSTTPSPIPSTFTFNGNDYPLHQVGTSSWFNTDPAEVDINNIPGMNTIDVGESTIRVNYPVQDMDCTYDDGLFIGAALPVELSGFEAQLEDQDIFIQWTTLSESYNAGFEIQQSWDGVRFTTIGAVNGAGLSTEPQQYAFVDKGVRIRALGDFSYYRLVQIDYDGAKTYSEIRTVNLNLELEKFEITKITGWGSASSKMKIYYYAPEIMRKFNFLLADIQGNVISRKSIYPDPGLNFIEIDLNGYDQSLYFLSMDNGREVISEKVAFNIR